MYNRPRRIKTKFLDKSAALHHKFNKDKVQNANLSLSRVDAISLASVGAVVGARRAEQMMIAGQHLGHFETGNTHLNSARNTCIKKIITKTTTTAKAID